MAFCATYDIERYDVNVLSSDIFCHTWWAPKDCGSGWEEAGWEPGRVLCTAIERSSCFSSRVPDALPKGSLLKSTSLLPPEPTKTTVVMEAISNHTEEEVRRVVTFFMNLWSMRRLVTPGHEVSSDKLTHLEKVFWLKCQYSPYEKSKSVIVWLFI